jgi:sugar/nucleoside kinase (ribokinase family)
VAALTRSEKGSVVISGEELHVVDAEPAKVLDTTGAGDAYAAGFLYGYTRGRDLRTCARLGGVLAAEVISHYGARAEADLKALVAPLL